MANQVETDLGVFLARACAAADGSAWQWDDRFRAALTVVDNAAAMALGDAYDGLFSESCTVDEMPSAPGPLRQVLMRMAGMREGQILFAHQMPGGPLVFAAFWPWGSEPLVSVRVGVEPAHGGAPSPDLVAAFGLGDEKSQS